LLQSQGNGGLDKGGEGQENYFSKNFGLEPICLDIESDWQKIILVIFLSSHLVALSSVLLLSLSFVANNTHEVVVCHADHTRFWTREKSDRRTVKQVVLHHPPAPVHVSLCHVAFPFPLCNADLPS
jgi:hypothetical protein